MSYRKFLGDSGEHIAAQHLQAQGFRILEKQFRTPFGEIDLICLDGDEIVFVEVKTRVSVDGVSPEESVTTQKIGHVLRSGEYYLDSVSHKDAWRIDVIAIETRGEKQDIVHIEAIDIPEKYW